MAAREALNKIIIIPNQRLECSMTGGSQEPRTGKKATTTCLPEAQLAILGLTVKDAIIVEMRPHVGLMVTFTTDKRKARGSNLGRRSS